MSLEKLPTNCISLVINYLPPISIQELAVTTKNIRSKCLQSSFNQPVTMPVSKTECPEILIKIATTIMVTETIEKTGSDWLLMVLTHFERVRTVKIMLKGLSRKKVHDIWEIVNKVRTVENLVVPNTELRKWSKANQKKQPRINLRPLYVSLMKLCSCSFLLI